MSSYFIVKYNYSELCVIMYLKVKHYYEHNNTIVAEMNKLSL